MAKPFWAIAILLLGLLGLKQLLATSEVKDDDAIIASGMEPQVKLIREISSDSGWNVECEGTSGRMTALKIVPGFLPWKSSEDALWDKLTTVATSLSTTARVTSTTGCDLPANTYEDEWVAPNDKVIVGVGPPEELEPLITLAQACEVKGARLTDGPPDQQAVYAGELPSDWVGLEVDPQLNPETGPLSCLMLLGNREYYSKDWAR